ncbi:MAG TPA: DUF4126 domain-containing protein [Thermomicrobiales bacterium]|nr:DUF4126 domain-containing protein [Thermomicrobiales bacterium]
MITTLLSGIGVSASCGLNATLPLLILALADRFSGTVNLDQPYDFFSSSWGIIILLVILPIELIADKIARVDHANDLLHTVILPAAGALSMMAIASQDDHINPVAALILGLVLGGGVHWFKTINRPLITIRTHGIGNPIVSVAEDLVAIVVTIVALFVPYAVIVALPLLGWLLYRLYVRLRSGRSSLFGLLAGVNRV